MPLTLLVVAEGDPETWECWSGSALGLVTALRQAGVRVIARNADLLGLRRAAVAALTFALSRRRWASRYHYGDLGFAMRSARAGAQLRGEKFDALLQIGATFNALRHTETPSFLYCDSNCRLAERHAPYGDIADLPPGELGRVAARERHVYERAAAIFTMSNYARRSFLSDFGLSEDGVTTVYAGANLECATIEPREHRCDGPPTILFVGRLWERKGGPLLLEAFRRVRSVLDGVRLRIVGATPAVGDEPGVELIGSIDKATLDGERRLREIYKTADIFCMPSRYEPFGMVFVEAMLHGLPCVAANHCAMPEIVEPAISGWLVPDGDVAALTDCLIRTLSNREVLAAVGRTARDRALKLFTWNRVADRIATNITARLAVTPARTS